MTEITSKEKILPSLRVNTRAKGFFFVIAMWLLSRLVVVVTMQVIAPLLYTTPSPVHDSWKPPYPLDFNLGFVPQPGWEIFSHWDGRWYHRIATAGYDYANDGQWHSIAFFPLFPLISRGVMMLGLPFEVAGTLVNNLAFLGALLLLYRWAEERHGVIIARWATAVLAWCPFSLYGSAIYTEGLFMLLTTAALRAFDKRHYTWAALWGALATATRATGITLIPTFLLVAWRERRPAIAYATGLFAGVGLLSFIVFCALSFGDPLAWVHAQRAWAQPNWMQIFKEALTLGSTDSLMKVVMVFGGGYLLWDLRHKLSSIVVIYGFCSLAMIIASGALSSVCRYAYAIVSLPLALGIFFSSYPRWGYLFLGWFAFLLTYYALNFARWYWVA